VWRYVYSVIDDDGQAIDVLVSKRRDTVAARRFFTAVIRDHGQPGEVVTDRAAALAKAIGELASAALLNTVQDANNRVEADHGRLKARLRPMRGLKRDCIASVIIKGHAFIQNVHRDHYELGSAATPPEANHSRIRRTPHHDQMTDPTRHGVWSRSDPTTQQSPRRCTSSTVASMAAPTIRWNEHPSLRGGNDARRVRRVC